MPAFNADQHIWHQVQQEACKGKHFNKKIHFGGKLFEDMSTNWVMCKCVKDFLY
jgi:hypothetical protein